MPNESPSVEKANAVRLNSASSGVPLFCLCGVMIYKSFAQHFSDNPVYGLFTKAESTAIDESSSRTQQLLSFDALTDSYAEGIKSVASGGEVILTGLSFGGTVALEVAKKLSQQGYTVEHIILLDTFTPNRSRRSFSKVLRDIKENFSRLGIYGTIQDLFLRCIHKAKRMSVSARTDEKRVLPHQLKLKRATRFSELMNTFTGSDEKYAFDVLLIKANELDMGFGMVARSDYGLSDIISGTIDIVHVEAGHIEVIKGAAAEKTYNAIMSYMNR